MQPFLLLHIESSVLAFLMNSFIGYRKVVIIDNLNRVGANTSNVSGVYRNLCDIAFESLKLFSISESALQSRVEYINIDILDKLYDEGRNVVLAGGHVANWEIFSLAMPLELKHKPIAIYKKLNNEVFDAALKSSRGRTGMEIIEMSENVSGVAEPFLCSFIFDQSPRSAKHAKWTTFLGQETAVYPGLEKFASRYNAAVVYASITRTGRGRYAMEFNLVEQDVMNTHRGEVLDKCLGLLESDIQKNPGDWLWTHRRWKHTRPSGVVLHERKFSKFESWS
jgi:KDO2-lipid IV(A) lauroyltransferase